MRLTANEYRKSIGLPEIDFDKTMTSDSGLPLNMNAYYTYPVNLPLNDPKIVICQYCFANTPQPICEYCGRPTE